MRRTLDGRSKASVTPAALRRAATDWVGHFRKWRCPDDPCPTIRAARARSHLQKQTKSKAESVASTGLAPRLSPSAKRQSHSLESRPARYAAPPRLTCTFGAWRSAAGRATVNPRPPGLGGNSRRRPTESPGGARKGRHDEPAQATCNAYPRTSPHGCGAVKVAEINRSSAITVAVLAAVATIIAAAIGAWLLHAR